MRFKYYLRGCGIGILFAALILMIGFHRNGKAEMTDEEVRERAAQLGMVEGDAEGLAEDTQRTTEPDESTEPATEAATEPGEPTEPDEPTEPTTETLANQPSNGTNNKPNRDPGADEPASSGGDAQPGAGDANAGSDAQPVTITVKPGAVCREIAEMLYEKGIVPDAEEFRLYMRDNGYDNLIQVGTFSVSPDMEYKEIAIILTTKPGAED